MLLGSSPNRRLTKDERQSPAIAEAAGRGAETAEKTQQTD
jgi:hypothetical protein